MRILFATTRSAGHFGPLVPFAHAARRAGHDVLVSAPLSAAGMVGRAGLKLRAHDDPPEAEVSQVIAMARRLSPVEANGLVFGEVFAGFHARSALPGLLATMRAYEPDVVVGEIAECASPLAAEKLGIPHVPVDIVLAFDSRPIWPYLVAGMARLRRFAGLPPEAAVPPTPVLTQCPPSMAPPADGDRRVLRFRERAMRRSPLGDWWPGNDAPLVYLTFGSVVPGTDAFPRLYRAAIDELAELPVRVLVTVGDKRDPRALGSLPPSVHVERWVPQADVMPHAAAMVGHGGSGTTLQALAAGVPQVVIPLFADQPANARRIDELGAGIALDGAAGVGQAVTALLDDRRHRTAARAVAHEIAGLPPVDDAVRVLEQVAYDTAPVPGRSSQTA
jgi:UDP:flavonoid glycosyltransferase YjiC (YdhE family)